MLFEHKKHYATFFSFDNIVNYFCVITSEEISLEV